MIVVCPVELVKIRMQNQSIGKQHISWAMKKLGTNRTAVDGSNLSQGYRGPLETTQDIICKEGPRGMLDYHFPRSTTIWDLFWHLRLDSTKSIKRHRFTSRRTRSPLSFPGLRYHWGCDLVLVPRGCDQVSFPRRWSEWREEEV